MVDPIIIESVRNYLKKVQKEGIVIRFGVVFGSQVTGQADHLSDIDLLVVSPRFDGSRDRRDIDLMWRLAARTHSRIEPIPCGERQWKEDVSSAVVEIARREGETITLR